jgi:RNA polymerase sigma-70 factor, ECF subfamily
MIVARPVEPQGMAGIGESVAGREALSATAELTRRMVKGEEEAFGQFYDLYSARLCGYLFVICRGNEQQARELLQETMIKVARYVRVFEEEEIFWKWLTVVARSCWVDENRKRNRYLAALERFWNWRSVDAAAVESDEMLMVGSLELLCEEDRTLLTQKYVEGLSVREIAQACGSSEKAVESRLTRARSRMKEVLKKT